MKVNTDETPEHEWQHWHEHLLQALLKRHHND